MKIVEESAEPVNGYESVAEFYAGKSVFITGGTGFLGKVLVEKLLYSCKDIGNIFLLIREKKGVNAEERVQQLLNQPLFSRIKSGRSQDLKKIVPIIGDINEVDFGISAADENKLIDKVSVVFHVAATIKFNEKLDVAVQTNVKGTQYALNLCHRMKRIKAFVHVSTAYCNTDQPVLEEKVYPPRVDLVEVLKFIQQPYLDKKIIQEKFLRGMPNTYTFTKGLAENYVSDHHGNVPTVIIRPSIVSPSLREPLKGWTDNWFGATGLVTASVKGANRVLFGDPENALDIIPVDYVVNCTIVAAAKCSSSNALTVYNTCTSSCNPISLKSFFDGVRRSAIEIGFHENSYPFLLFTRCEWALIFLTFLLQTVPAYLADLFTWASGKRPKKVKLQSRVIYGRNLLNFFTAHQWEMKANNVKSLHASLSHTDKATFPFDPSDINWKEYLSIFVKGVEKYLMK